MSTLANKAVLADLTIGKYSGSKADKDVAEFALGEYHANKDAGRFSKKLFPPSALSEINAIASKMFEYHRKVTLPWGKDARILPAKMILEYRRTINEYSSQFAVAVKKFLEGYEPLVQAQRGRLGDMFKESDYPTLSDITAKFKVGTTIEPIPDAGDFRIEIGDEMIEELKADLESSQNDRLKMVTTDIFKRFHKQLSTLREKLDDPKNIFRDSLFENLLEMVKLLPALNLTDDPELNKMGFDIINDILVNTPDMVRADAEKRATIVSKTDEIIANMSVFMG